MLTHWTAGAPPRDGSTVLVLLHGRGSHGRDLQALAPGLPPEWVLVTPQAPWPSAPWGYGPGWAWYRYAGEDRAEEATLEPSLAELDTFLAGLPGLLGAEPGAVVLGGFSQGGTTSFAWALTRPGRVAAALNLSGFLVDSPLLPDERIAASRTPLFWAHGRSDPAIPWALAERGRARLDRLGAPLTRADYDIGHWVDPQELADAVAWIREVSPPTRRAAGEG